MRTSLEIYLLTLIREGLGTPYELKSRADLSLGSTVPALGRLEKEGLIKKSKLQARRSRRFTLTSKGQKCVRTEWRKQLKAESGDLDSILRITHLIWIHGTKKQAADYLRRAGVRFSALAKAKEIKPNRFGNNMYKVDNDAMRWLRARIGACQKAAVADELIRISSELTKTGTRRAGDLKRRPKKY